MSTRFSPCHFSHSNQTVWLTGALAWLVTATLAIAAEQPNIVLILADDLGYGDLGCYGQKDIRTPRLDQMAARGLRFTQFYAGATVCAPSRCVLMTGLHGGHCRVRGNAGGLRQSLRSEDTTVASVLKKAGYDTALIGKWGLGNLREGQAGLPTRHGFDYFYGYLDQMHAHNYYPSFLIRGEEQAALRNSVPDERPTGAGVSDNRLDYTPDLFFKEAQQFIRDHREQPFFLELALTTPHANNEAGKQGMEVPHLGEYEDKNWPAPRKGHAAIISRMDAGIGQLVDLLAELKLDRKTLVLFTSDNGPHAEGGYNPEWNDSNGPFSGSKRSLTDGGIRVPLIAYWPGKIAAEETDAIACATDILPTLAELGAGKAPSGLDGLTLVPIFNGTPQPARNERYLYWEFHESGFDQASRRGPWKAIRHGRQPLELYNLVTDVAEKQNVAAEYPEIVKQFETYFRTARNDSPDWPIQLRKSK